MQISQREIADALGSEPWRWARDSPSAPGQHAATYGEGSAEDVSDAALLLCMLVMLTVELYTGVGAAPSMDEIEP